MNGVLKEKTIVIGIGGGIAAYKSCELVRLLVRHGAEVHVVMTAAACEFVTPLTLQTLSKNSVHSPSLRGEAEAIQRLSRDCFVADAPRNDIRHIQLADSADIIVVAPATANLIARAAHGLANDLLTNILLATRAPVLFCPSMNVNMWHHRATQYNVGRLRELGYKILEPAEGELACGWEGKGRLVEPEEILGHIQKFISGGGRV